MSNSINSLYSQGNQRLRFVYQTQPQRLLDNTRTAQTASWRKKPDTDKTQKDAANLLGGFYCRTSLHHSFTPLSALSRPHLQQAFPGNLPAKSVRETSRPTKQVDELQISLSLLVQSPSLIPRSAVDYFFTVCLHCQEPKQILEEHFAFVPLVDPFPFSKAHPNVSISVQIPMPRNSLTHNSQWSHLERSQNSYRTSHNHYPLVRTKKEIQRSKIATQQ